MNAIELKVGKMVIVPRAACEHVVADEPPPKAFPKPGDYGTTLSMASWNIRDGRNVGLELAARSFDSLGVDIGFVQETKCCRATFAAKKALYTPWNANQRGCRQLLWVT